MTSGNSEQQSSLDKAREWLDRAASWLENAPHMPESDDIRAAALIGQGYAQLGAVEQTARFQAAVDARHEAERAADLERIAAADARVWAFHESESEAHAAVVEAHKAMTERMRAEQALLGDVDAAAVGAAVARVRQAAEEARPHDGELVRCGFEGCESRALASGRCGLLAHAVPPSECGCGGPLAHDSLDPRCAYFAGRGTYRG